MEATNYIMRKNSKGSSHHNNHCGNTKTALHQQLQYLHYPTVPPMQQPSQPLQKLLQYTIQ
jgi:hypothetical protein